MTLKLVGSLKTRTFRVLWLLEELGLDYEHEPAAPRSEAALAINPSGKVPALVAEGAVITDSTAIMTYLADRHGCATHPAGTIGRAHQDAVTFFLLDEFDAGLWTASRHSFILPEEMRLPDIKDSLKWEFGRSVERFGRMIEDKPFAAGEIFTVADIVATHCCNWAINARFPVTDAAVLDYVERMRARPAYQRAWALRGD